MLEPPSITSQYICRKGVYYYSMSFDPPTEQLTIVGNPLQVKRFSQLSKVYDAIMADIDYDLWSEFIFKQLNKRAPNTSWQGTSILDIGCGTGNSLIPLIDKGYDLVGLDASAEMLAIAKEKCPTVDLHLADFRNFELEQRFDLVISVFDSLNNLLTQADFLLCLKQVHKHLNANGYIMFDVNTTVGLRHLWENDRMEGWVGDIHYLWTHSFDEDTKLATVKAHCSDGKSEFEEIHYEKPYDVGELKELMAEAGFGNVSVICEPFGTEAEEDDERVWVIGQKSVTTTNN